MWTKRRQRGSKGVVLAEATASTVITIGVTFCLLYVLIQAAVGVLIVHGLHQSARQSARELAVLYSKNGGGRTPDSASINSVLGRAMVPGVVNHTDQFIVTWPTTYRRNAHPSPVVSVVCSAIPGRSGSGGNANNVAFPWTLVSWFDKAYSLAGIQLKSSAVYPLKP